VDVKAMEWLNRPPQPEEKPAMTALAGRALPNDFLDEFERMDPVQRQLILDELADRPDLWNGQEVLAL